jgi:squalene-hopene/tetraprenyl-beta-curcumene cyclase
MTRLLSACLLLWSFSALAAEAPKPLQCAVPKADKERPTAPPDRSDPKARQAAQRGLEFLVLEATAWQKNHQCYGCHVHSVTMEALSVGIHNQYDIPRSALDTLLEGMTKMSGGSRTPDGLSYQHSSSPATTPSSAARCATI